MNLLLLIAIILISGLICGRAVKLLKLPNVTGYLIAGLLLGRFVFNILDAETLEGLSSVSEMALAFIAFTIGLIFKKEYFKRVGIAPVIIAIFEALFAVIAVTGVLLIIGCDPAFSIMLGSIAAATAPAATIMVIKQFKAKGPVTDMLMSVVAIDDAVALVLFGFSVAIAKVVGGDRTNIVMSIVNPLLEIVYSLGIGLGVALIMKVPMMFFKKAGNRLIILIAAIFLTSSLATLAGGSELLACMMLGAVLTNITTDSEMMGDLADFITPPLFLMFFVVSGAELDISVIPKIGLVGIVYVLVRVVGKCSGAFLGAKLTKQNQNVKKFLGPALIPQAGVAIGLSLVATQLVPEHGAEIRAVILCATLLYEIVGPAITKLSLTKAGEIQTDKSI